MRQMVAGKTLGLVAAAEHYSCDGRENRLRTNEGGLLFRGVNCGRWRRAGRQWQWLIPGYAGSPWLGQWY